MWENTIYESADHYNATIDVWVKLFLAMNLQGTIVYWEEKGRGRVLRLPVCSGLNSSYFPFLIIGRDQLGEIV